MKIAKQNKIYYLAGPYSSNSKGLLSEKIREQNYKDIVEAAIILTQAGFILLEPIAMCHHALKLGTFPPDYEFWKNRDRNFIKRCDGVIVTVLRGWDDSKGVKDEIQYAKRLKKPIYYFDPKSATLSKDVPLKVKAIDRDIIIPDKPGTLTVIAGGK